MSAVSDGNASAGLSIDARFDTIGADDWRALADASLDEGQTIEDLARMGLDGLAMQPLYWQRPMDSPVNDAADSDAGSSVDTLERRSDGWDNRLAVIGDTLDARRERLMAGLDGGVRSLQIAIGDASGATTANQLGLLLDDVHLQMVTISVDAGHAPEMAAAALFACWEAADGVDASTVKGALNVDPLRLQRQPQMRSIADDMSSLTRLASTTTTRFASVRSVTVNTVDQHNAGASPVTELVAAIAAGDRYLDAMIGAGLDTERAASQMVFHTALGPDFLRGAVKLRALRRLWLHVLAHYDAQPVHTPIVAETSARYTARREPWMNHLRHVLAAMAAGAGGADTLIVHPHNRVDGEWLDEETALGFRMARNIAPMLERESHWLGVVDPLAGSYAAESMTDELCRRVWDELGQLQRDGGYLQALDEGRWARRLEHDHREALARLSSGEAVMVGVNRFHGEDTPSVNAELDTEIDAACAAASSARAAPLRRLAQAFGT